MNEAIPERINKRVGISHSNDPVIKSSFMPNTEKITELTKDLIYFDLRDFNKIGSCLILYNDLMDIKAGIQKVTTAILFLLQL
jgi:hypothetical protein